MTTCSSMTVVRRKMEPGVQELWFGLKPGTPAQRAELTGLTKTLRQGEGKSTTVHRDSRYAFTTIHVHSTTVWTIDRERGLFITAGERILKTKKNARRWWPTHLFIQCSVCVLAGQKTAPDLITNGCEPPCGCWELNSGPLEEQSVLLTSEPSPQHLAYTFNPHSTLYPFSFYSGTMRGFLLSASFGFFLFFLFSSEKAPRSLLYRKKLFSHFPIFLLLNASDIKDIITPY